MREVPELYVDLDGVLGNFDKHFLDCFKVPCTQDTYEPPQMWDWIRAHGNFYREIPPYDYLQYFWGQLLHFHSDPIILTGIPYSIPHVEEQKRQWVDTYLGSNVGMIACRSVDKKNYCNPGDILIDDRTKYRHLWLEKGGIYILHTNHHQTIADLSAIVRSVPGWVR
jgi:hypothetical protein